jgi:hypothetical protein
MTVSDEMIERAAKAIYDCPLSDGDPAGTLIFMSEYVVPAFREEMKRQTLDICKTIARAALTAALEAGAVVPVAWQFQALSGAWSICSQPCEADMAKAPERFRPLYATPVLEAGAWQDASSIPAIKRGTMREFIAAVYRKHSDKVYTFSATYLNAYALTYEWGCPKGDGCEGSGCDDGCPTTGWFLLTGEEDEGSTYHALDFKDGDMLMGWQELPKWDDAFPRQERDTTTGGAS